MQSYGLARIYSPDCVPYIKIFQVCSCCNNRLCRVTTRHDTYKEYEAIQESIMLAAWGVAILLLIFACASRIIITGALDVTGHLDFMEFWWKTWNTILQWRLAGIKPCNICHPHHAPVNLKSCKALYCQTLLCHQSIIYSGQVCIQATHNVSVLFSRLIMIMLTPCRWNDGKMI